MISIFSIGGVVLFLIIIYFGIIISKIPQYRKACKRIVQKNEWSSKKGDWAERKLEAQLLALGFSSSNIYRDIYIRKKNGRFSQVDVVLLTGSGIIVFEVKNYIGAISGNEKYKNWRCLKFTRKGMKEYSLYNPILQNKGHILAIRENLVKNKNIPIFSVVVFFGDCKIDDVAYYSDDTYVIKSSSLSSTIESILSCHKKVSIKEEEIRKLFNLAERNSWNKGVRDSQLRTAKFYNSIP